MDDTPVGRGMLYVDLVRMSKRGFNLIFKRRGIPVDPEHIVDCITYLWKEIPKFRQDIGDGKGTIGGYLSQRAVYFAQSRLKKQIREWYRAVRMGEMGTEVNAIPCKQREVDAFAASDWKQCETWLTDEQIELAEHRWIHGKTHRELGEMLGLSHEGVRKQLLKIERVLREKLESQS